MVPRSPLPWPHIAEEVAGEALARGFKRLASTGTRWPVDSEVYPDALRAQGLAYMRPTPKERYEINRIIMDELVCSVFKTEVVAYFQRVYARMKDAGCDAVVLGCTEIPLIISDTNSPLPTLDSTRLLARAGAAARRGRVTDLTHGSERCCQVPNGATIRARALGAMAQSRRFWTLANSGRRTRVSSAFGV